MEEDLLDVDLEDDDRLVTLHDHLVGIRRIREQLRPSVDAQGVAAAGDEEDQADVRVLQDVGEPVGTLVARSLGDRERRVVDDECEPSGVALRRHVAAAARIRRCHQAERRRGEPSSVLGGERRSVLVEDTLHGLAKQLS